MSAANKILEAACTCMNSAAAKLQHDYACNMQGKERKAFVQSFFLATQERGYFVLNDTFRYLSNPSKAFAADFAAPDVVSNGSPQQYGAQHEVQLCKPTCLSTVPASQCSNSKLSVLITAASRILSSVCIAPCCKADYECKIVKTTNAI